MGFLVMLLIVVAYPTRRRRQASAPSCRAAARPTAPPARHHVLLPRGPRRPCGQFPGRVGRAFAGRTAAQAGPILVLLRAALQCHTARPATLVLLVPPVANAVRAFNRRRWSTKSTSVSRAISRRGVAAPASGVARGGTCFRGSVFREQALLTRKGWGVERAPPAVVCYFRALRGTEGRK
jgi:hypothetical protein